MPTHNGEFIALSHGHPSNQTAQNHARWVLWNPMTPCLRSWGSDAIDTAETALPTEWAANWLWLRSFHYQQHCSSRRSRFLSIREAFARRPIPIRIVQNAVDEGAMSVRVICGVAPSLRFAHDAGFSPLDVNGLVSPA